MTPSTKNWRSRQIELLDTTMTNQAKNTIRHDPLLQKTGGQDKPNFFLCGYRYGHYYIELRT